MITISSNFKSMYTVIVSIHQHRQENTPVSYKIRILRRLKILTRKVKDKNKALLIP